MGLDFRGNQTTAIEGSMSKAHAFNKFSGNVAAKPEPEVTPAKAARGTAPRVGIAVRVSREDWKEMHAFALNQSKSLNTLLIEGFQALQREAGVPPIKGSE